MKNGWSLLVVLLLFKCQSFKEEDKYLSKGDGLWIVLNAVVVKDDQWQLMYQTDKIQDWTSTAELKKDVSGYSRAQKIVFKIPQGTKITKIRIDLGDNEDQDFLDIYKITFFKNGKKLEIKRELISKYFVFNKYVVPSDESVKMHLIKINDKYDPIMVSTRYFIKLLNQKIF